MKITQSTTGINGGYKRTNIYISFLEGKKKEILEILKKYGITNKLLKEYGSSIDELLSNAEKIKKSNKSDFKTREENYKKRVSEFIKENPGKKEEDYNDEFYGINPDKYSYIFTEIIIGSKGEVITIIQCTGIKK